MLYDFKFAGLVGVVMVVQGGMAKGLIILGIVGLLLLVVGVFPNLRRRTPPANVSLASSVFTHPRIQQQDWLISGNQAKRLIEQQATVLDTRPQTGGKWIKNAQRVQWQEFSQSDAPHRGKLWADRETLEDKIQQLGIKSDHPVVVFGSPLQGWGESGRIVWMLRTLGHSQAYLVDGGITALFDAGVEESQESAVESGNIEQGTFTIQFNPQWTIDREQFKAQWEADEVIPLDTREPREFRGATPYGERRGGHVPGAVSLYYKTLLGEDGRLLPREEIEQLLGEKGINSEDTLVAYCTGGIRSAWVTAVLADLGYRVQNYPGSMWEWSAFPASAYPLVQEKYQ
ncbi:rhodanese-like domain-containing protein [Spirulina sp. CS-785/01]|uniref:sulfurtransferase n=1 Tax=Spirulina sp. CS-785/01 TaxID=3021716 RepID=UPI00232DEF08|nr:rhodanese-like domain-containing protein [Spirulina sp. CS-785/01]MDB9313924.1 rhodanese-like domain-containing protein [Spirulina sp. CS-785/01]